MRRSSFLVIYATVFIDLMGFGVILPQLPFYLQHLGATGVGVGATLTAFSGAQFFAAPLLGRLSDRIGRRPVILASLVGTSLSLTVSGLATTLPLLIASRALAGMFGGSVGPAQAYIADSTTPAERAKYMGGVGAAIGLGLVTGPALGAALSGFGFGTAAFVAAGISLLNFAFGWFKLPETNVRRTRRASLTRSWFVSAVRRPNVARILAVTFLAMFAFVGMEATFALLGEERYGLTPLGLGLILSYVGGMVVVTQAGLVGPINARVGERYLAVIGAVLISVGLAALPLWPNLLGAATMLGMVAVGQGLLNPGLTTLNSLVSDPDAQGGALGLGQSFGAAARVVGPITAGWLFDIDSGLPYFVGGVLAFSAVLLMLTMRGIPRAALAPDA